MGTCNQYYFNKYDSCVPIESYGEQFKNYIDEKFKNVASNDDIDNIVSSVTNSEKNITDSLSNVETNLAGSISNIESNLSQSICNAANKTVCCVKEAILNSENSIVCNTNSAKDEIICNITNMEDNIKSSVDASINEGMDGVKQDIIDDLSSKMDDLAKNVENNITSAITTSADNVVKAGETIAKNVESNISGAITTSADNVANVVRNESNNNKNEIDKLREDLIQAINNSDSLTSAGFSDLNTAVVANKEDAVYRINRHSNVNKKEIINAINGTAFEPYVAYGGTVLNLTHNNVSTLQESDILGLSSVNVDSYSPDIHFSIRITDVAVEGMNDDPTGALFNEAKERNELNVVFAYPSEYDNVEVLDSIDMNITSSFDKKELAINGKNYTIIMQCSKIANLYDPKWESPSDYTLNYTLNIG